MANVFGVEDLIPLAVTEPRLRTKEYLQYVTSQIGLGLFKDSEYAYVLGLFICDLNGQKIWSWTYKGCVDVSLVERFLRAMYLADAIGSVDAYLLSHCYEVMDDDNRSKATLGCMHRLRGLNENIFQIQQRIKSQNLSKKLTEIIGKIQKTLPIAA